MPWCAECNKYLTPSSMRDDGTCPACGRPVEAAERTSDRSSDRSSDAPVEASPVVTRPQAVEEDETAPWHFKLLVVALVVYLGWRFVEIFV